MSNDEQASVVVSELRKPIESAAAKAHRRCGGTIELDELRSQAIEAVLVFAGLMPSRRSGDAGKLDAWRQLPARQYRRYVQHALDFWLSSYAAIDQKKRARRPSTVTYDGNWENAPEENSVSAPESSTSNVSWLTDATSSDGYEAVELRMVMADYPVLRLRYLKGLSERAVAHHMRLGREVIRRREAEEKAELRERWAA
jgi:hypothetical protein